MDIQVGDVIRIKEYWAAGTNVKVGDLLTVMRVCDDGSIRASNGYFYSPKHYDLIARAVKPDTGETVREMAKRLCEGRSCNDCPVNSIDSETCAVLSASAGRCPEKQLAILYDWADKNPPTPKPVNRVLTMCEVYALPEGAEVYVEERGSMYPSTVAKREGTAFKDWIGRYDMNQLSYYIENNKLRMRFWLLPQPPTEAEKAANPW